jgi:hypothetical protein
MLKRVGGALAAAAAAFGVFAASAEAQNLEDRIAAHREWSVYRYGSGDSRVCWISSTPLRWEARRGGQRVTVQRGEIFFNVAVRPGQGVDNEPSFVAGYPLRSDPVRVQIGADRFEMLPIGGGGEQGEFAWLRDADRDDDLVAAMRGGAEAVVTGVSTRGTTTVDTFSLMGFTAALQRAREACAQ